MKKEAIELITKNAIDAEHVVPIEIGGHTYVPGRTPVNLLVGPAPDALPVATLAAIVDYLDANRDLLVYGDTTVHVRGPRSVTVLGKLDKDNRRHMYLAASPAGDDLDMLGKQLEPEAFVVSLLTRFKAGAGDHAALLQSLGNITVGDVRTLADDGVTQEITTKTGAARVGTQTLRNPVLLSPLRSFPEIDLPLVPYVIRAMARDNRLPLLTLHEADGGAWRVHAIELIGSWLKNQLPKEVALLA